MANEQIQSTNILPKNLTYYKKQLHCNCNISSATLLGLPQRCFSMKFAKFFKNTFFIEDLRWLLLCISNTLHIFSKNVSGWIS